MPEPNPAAPHTTPRPTRPYPGRPVRFLPCRYGLRPGSSSLSSRRFSSQPPDAGSADPLLPAHPPPDAAPSSLHRSLLPTAVHPPDAAALVPTALPSCRPRSLLPTALHSPDGDPLLVTPLHPPDLPTALLHPVPDAAPSYRRRSVRSICTPAAVAIRRPSELPTRSSINFSSTRDHG